MGLVLFPQGAEAGRAGPFQKDLPTFSLGWLFGPEQSGLLRAPRQLQPQRGSDRRSPGLPGPVSSPSEITASLGC